MQHEKIDKILQPLRIPAGWSIDYNIFAELEANAENMEFFYGAWLFLASHKNKKLGLELRYEPEGDPLGHFVLEYYRINHNFESKKQEQVLIEEVISKSRLEIVSSIERFMATPHR